jgi:hypothetical protein
VCTSQEFNNFLSVADIISEDILNCHSGDRYLIANSIPAFSLLFHTLKTTKTLKKQQSRLNLQKVTNVAEGKTLPGFSLKTVGSFHSIGLCSLLLP